MLPRPLVRQFAAAAAGIAGSAGVLLAVLQASAAQNPPTTRNPPAHTTSRVRKGALSNSSNTAAGEITAIDIPADTLSVRDRTGKSWTYLLGQKTRYNLNRRPAQRSDFKVGASIVLHFRRSRTDDSLTATEVDDGVSWTWLRELRRATTAATIEAITDDSLSVTIGADRVPLDYTVSDKTRWQKGGKEVAPAAFHTGDRIFVLPRSLPSGSIMARAVSDTIAGAAQEKERLAASLHGTITNIEPSAHRIVLKTVTGDSRGLAYSEDIEVVVNGKPLTIDALKVGLLVTARIRHGAAGDESVWRITIDARRKGLNLRKAHPASGKGVATQP